ncbi:MAG: hypothetical protein ACYSVY_00790 [Planctomycetota bacterium]|jgi:hypothetical protein
MQKVLSAILVGIVVTVGVGAAIGVDAFRWSMDVAATTLPGGVSNPIYPFVADVLGPVMLALPGIAAAAMFAYRRRSRPGHCQSCGYDLRGSAGSARCPECGTQI